MPHHNLPAPPDKTLLRNLADHLAGQTSEQLREYAIRARQRRPKPTIAELAEEMYPAAPLLGVSRVHALLKDTPRRICFTGGADGYHDPGLHPQDQL